MWFGIWMASALAAPLHDRIDSNLKLTLVGIEWSDAEIYVPDQFDDPNEFIYWAPAPGVDDFGGRFASPERAMEALVKDWHQIMSTDLSPLARKALQVDIEISDKPIRFQDGLAKKGGIFQSEFAAARVQPSLTKEAVARRAIAAASDGSEGVGLVIVVDRLARKEKQACVWPTFVDMSSRKVLWTERRCAKPGGSTFRSYWYGGVKKAVKEVLQSIGKDEL